METNNIKWIDIIIDYAKNELRMMNFDKIELGETIVNLIRQLHEISGNSPRIMKSIIMSIADLIDEKPITPITESDFKLETHTDNGNVVEIWRCTRYPHVYKAPDGKYYNDRAIVYKTRYDSLDKKYIYQGGLSSKQEIVLPYLVSEKIVIVSS